MDLRPAFSWAFVAVLGATACTGDPGPAGQKGDPGAKGDKGDPGINNPSLSAVTPASAFLARTIDVTISGNGTSFTDKTTIDFGPKIKVNTLAVASPTALVANITVDGAASLGPRDIKVTNGGAGDLTYASAFDVRSPLKITIDGTTAQGSVYYVHARGLDFTTPFDTTSTGDGFFTPLVYTNISVAPTPGVYGDISGVSDYVTELRFVTDVDTAAGPQDISIQSGPPKDFADFNAPAAYTVDARAPVALTPGTSTPFTVGKPAASTLLSYTPADVAIRIVDISLSATDADAFPAAYFLPKSGKFNDLFAAGSSKTFVATSTDPFYLIALDGSPTYAGYTGKVKVDETVAMSADEKEPNDSKNLAVSNGAAAPPFVTLKAGLSDGSDEDFYAVTVGAADVGKSIRAQTTGMDPLTDTVVDILAMQGNSLVSIGPDGKPSDDGGYLDELTSDPTAEAGTYFVKVYPSTFFDAAHKNYDLVIRLE